MLNVVTESITAYITDIVKNVTDVTNVTKNITEVTYHCFDITESVIKVRMLPLLLCYWNNWVSKSVI